MVFTVSTVRQRAAAMGQSATRVWTYASGQPSFLGRLLSMVFVVLFALLALAILIPILILSLAAGLLFLAYIKCRLWLARAKQPNGALDGRRNVRVRAPQDDATHDVVG